MSIHELLSKFEAKDLKCQMVDQCLTDITASRKGARITIASDALSPTDVATGSGPVGWIIWIPREKYANAFKNEETQKA
jgi:hypothetical protein